MHECAGLFDRVTPKVAGVLIAVLAGLCVLFGVLFIRAYRVSADGMSTEQWTQRQIDTALRSGAMLSAALHQYESAEQKVPKSLDVLVPMYVDAIPQPPVGWQPWRYEAKTPGFRLSISPNTAHYPCCYYDRESREWEVDQ